MQRVRGRLAGPVELAFTVAIAVGIALLLQAFVVKPYRIPSLSMFPTIKVGQRVLANRLDTHPHLGDIVVFHPPSGANPGQPVCGEPDQGPGHPQPCDRSTRQQSAQTFIKRVVGLPGDRIAIRDGQVIRNGAREKAPYAQPCRQTDTCTFTKTITVPPGHYYMMGDNRGNSDDSRFWGPVAQRWIIGVAFVTYWPPGRIGTL